MKTWRDLKHTLPEQLSPTISETEALSFFKILTEHYTGQYNLPPASLDEHLPPEALIELDSILIRLKQEEPIQYVLGYTWFYNLRIQVDERVLIPRQETEELVHWILQDLQLKPGPKVLDIGTGSGCISLALAAYMRMPTVIATDISEKALIVAKQNALANEIYSVKFQKNDILNEALNLSSKVDVIVSNPPYIKPSDKKIMTKNVLDYEPHLALFATESDPLIFYKAIAEQALKHLSENGKLFFEINEFFKTDLEEMLQAMGFSQLESKKDLNGNWRMIKCER